MTTWILVANAAEAKLLTSENLHVGSLKPLREFFHPDSRKKATELTSDKPGRYQSDNGAHGAYNKNDPKEVEAEHFAIQLAHELKAGLGQNSYQHLVIISPAHFYGLINEHLEGHIPEVTHISKDYTKYPLPKLSSSLKEHLFG